MEMEREKMQVVHQVIRRVQVKKNYANRDLITIEKEEDHNNHTTKLLKESEKDEGEIEHWRPM
ncbi:unnamed protein product [Arabis nemorensis]|uniref:Uncharacterized protein n=1 Tax=Arabis nemorensis TaxID=586526 RepID=A0A565BC58_9BRAS|nr:unnamed protein product [Arabis nemorensis]